jgi:hypothetical protein
MLPGAFYCDTQDASKLLVSAPEEKPCGPAVGKIRAAWVNKHRRGPSTPLRMTVLLGVKKNMPNRLALMGRCPGFGRKARLNKLSPPSNSSRATNAVSPDKSVRRSAQDDGFVGGEEKHAKQIGAYGTLSWVRTKGKVEQVIASEQLQSRHQRCVTRQICEALRSEPVTFSISSCFLHIQPAVFQGPPQNRHPERSASQMDRVTQRLWRGVEGPRRRLFTHAARSFLLLYARCQQALGSRPREKTCRARWLKSSGLNTAEVPSAPLRMTVLWGVKKNRPNKLALMGRCPGLG